MHAYQLVDPSNPSSVDGVEADEYISYYPNPASDVVNVNFSAQKDVNAIFMLYSMAGSLIKQQALVGNENQISISDLPKGMYLIKVVNGKDMFSQLLNKKYRITSYNVCYTKLLRLSLRICERLKRSLRWREIYYNRSSIDHFRY